MNDLYVNNNGTLKTKTLPMQGKFANISIILASHATLLECEGSPMRTTCPTTWSARTLSHFIESNSDTPCAGFHFLRRRYPANPLVARKWCNV